MPLLLKSIGALDFEGQLSLFPGPFLCPLSSAPEMAPIANSTTQWHEMLWKAFKKETLSSDIQTTWNRYFISKAAGSFSCVGAVPPTDAFALWLCRQWEGCKAFSRAPYMGGRQGDPDRGAEATDLSLFLVPKYLKTQAKLHMPGNFWTMSLHQGDWELPHPVNACLRFETLPAGFPLPLSPSSRR